VCIRACADAPIEHATENFKVSDGRITYFLNLNRALGSNHCSKQNVYLSFSSSL
jgi:hypothetical protein